MSEMTNRKSATAKTTAGEVDKTAQDTVRYTKLIEATSDKFPEKVRPYVKQAAPILATGAVYFQIALPHIIHFVVLVEDLVLKLPTNVIMAIIGFCICFFGGVFPATIAAAEAWRLCGGMKALEYCKDIFQEMKKVHDADAEDDKKDEDGDGVADVDQLDGKELLRRKVRLGFKTVDPTTISVALTGIYTGWIGVLSVLKIQFAKTVTLGNVVGEKLYSIAVKAEPHIVAIIPGDYSKWVPTVVQWACKVFAITIAWWIQKVMSAIHSAIRGGFMFSECLCEVLKEKGVDVPYEKEIIGWAVAACGLLFQFSFGFGVPFPLNLITWPLKIVEWFIIYSVSSVGQVKF